MPCRVLRGEVVSNRREKTVTVLVVQRVKDSRYGKIVKRSRKYSAHLESGQLELGASVTIRECRPYSKTKTWEVLLDGVEA